MSAWLKKVYIKESHQNGLQLFQIKQSLFVWLSFISAKEKLCKKLPWMWLAQIFGDEYNRAFLFWLMKLRLVHPKHSRSALWVWLMLLDIWKKRVWWKDSFADVGGTSKTWHQNTFRPIEPCFVHTLTNNVFPLYKHVKACLHLFPKSDP